MVAPSAVVIDELDKPLPLDARVKRGQLQNGLTYYILPHQKPERRAQMWLLVNAGSVLEDDDQRGLAHLVEHMAFNGTRRFPKQALSDFLEKSGVRFGADLNAYTGFDETVYMLQVPTDNAALLQQSVSVLRDWADGVSFDAAEVDKERPVVLEEWRLGRGAGMRMFDKQAPVTFHGSKYAERVPIGKPEIIKGAPREALLRFYRDWYRPELMAVVAVGDFEPTSIEAQIKAEFSSLRGPEKPRPRPAVPVPPHRETLVSVDTDPEVTEASVSILSKLPHRAELSARDYRRKLSESLFNAVLNERLDELRRKPDAPFLGAGSGVTPLVRTTDALRQSVRIKDDAVISGFGALLQEVLRVERHGFTETEVERAKLSLVRRYEHTVKQRDKLEARTFADEIKRHFLLQETMPGPEAELALVQKLLPTLSVAELNQLGKSFGDASRVILVTGPAQLQKPSVDSVLAVNREIEARPIEPYTDRSADLKLLPKPPAPGAIRSTRTLPELGVTEWTLKNGVKVVAKPTRFRTDEVRMSAASPGGTSLVKDADFNSARFADTLVSQGGLGTLDELGLHRALAGKIASVTPSIRELEEGLNGQAATADLEVLLQMTYLRFTAPRIDKGEFASWRARESERARHRLLSPERTFAEAMEKLNTRDHLRRRPVTPEVLQQVDLDKAYGIYRDRFGDAGDFTFFFVGDFELEQLKPLVETYLGSLPTRGRKEAWRDVNVRWPNGVQTTTVQRGSEPKAMASLTFHGEKAWSREAENDLRSLREVLRLRLREVLREDMGGTYGVYVSGGFSRRPRQQYALTIGFGCAPENVDKLKQAVFDTIHALQKDGTAEDYLTKVREGRRRTHQTDREDNGFWLRELERAYVLGDDPKLILDIEPLIAQVTSERVRAAARQYVSDKQYVFGLLTPEAPK